MPDPLANRVRDLPEMRHIQFEEPGEYHFKGIERLRVYQLLAEGLPSDFRPISGKCGTSYGNLPHELGSFVGRGDELDQHPPSD